MTITTAPQTDINDTVCCHYQSYHCVLLLSLVYYLLNHTRQPDGLLSMKPSMKSFGLSQDDAHVWNKHKKNQWGTS